MKQPYLLFAVLLFHSIAITTNLMANTDIVSDLTKQIDNTANTSERSRLLVFRARNNLKKGNIVAAEQDYLAALALDSQGPTWASLADLYAQQKEYNKAKKALDKIDREFAYLNDEVSTIRALVEKQLRIAHLKENPPDIILDTEPNHGYVSRVQLIDQLKSQQVTNQQSSIDSIYSDCKRKWGNDYRMVEYCIDEQKKAKVIVASHKGGIRERCEDKWGNDFRMIEHCINEQTIAKRNLDNAYRNNDKRMYCTEKWGKDYRMVEYCMQN